MATTTEPTVIRESDAAAGGALGLAAAAAGDRIVQLNGFEDLPIGYRHGGGQFEILKDLIKERDARAVQPARIVGTSVHQELDSFIAHVNRFKAPNSAVYADNDAVRLTAVLNYHAKSGEPRWGDHRSVYACPLSKEWKRWTERNEKPMGQEEFGQFLEDNFPDLGSPAEGDPQDVAPPARMVEVARHLVVRTNGEFSRQINPTTGETALVCKTDHGPESTKIPRAFLLGIPVFDAGERWRVEARVRFTMAEGRPRFAYSLYQAEAVKRTAFVEVRKRVAEATSLPLFAGTPE